MDGGGAAPPSALPPAAADKPAPAEEVSSPPSKAQSAADEQRVAAFLSLRRRAKEAFDSLIACPCWAPASLENDRRVLRHLNELWAFQQAHRAALSRKDLYGIKRWEIGEIAANIAQLCYVSYLRSADVGQLRTAFSFYEALRDRQYFTLPSALTARHLQYLQRRLRCAARFFLVCLLLPRLGEARRSFDEMTLLAAQYLQLLSAERPGPAHGPQVDADRDAQVYDTMLREAGAMLRAESSACGSNCAVSPYRCAAQAADQQAAEEALLQAAGESLAAGSSPPRRPRHAQLRHAVIACHAGLAAKFSEMPLDMLRVAGAVERDRPAQGSPPAPLCRRFLLYRPLPDHVLAAAHAAAAVAADTHDSGSAAALLLYLNGIVEEAGMASPGRNGLLLGSSSDEADAAPSAASPLRQSSPTAPRRRGDLLYWDDLGTLGRVPCMVILEAHGAARWMPHVPTAEQQGLSEHGQPLFVILAARRAPPGLGPFSAQESGALLTHFLCAPVAAWARLSGRPAGGSPRFAAADFDARLSAVLLSQLVAECPSVCPFLCCPLLRRLVLRLCFALAALREHCAGAPPGDVLPSSVPELPSAVSEHPGLGTLLRELAAAAAGSPAGEGKK